MSTASRAWTEPEVRAFLAEHGLGTGEYRTAVTADQAIAESEELGYPVALKVVSREIVHKSDAGGVRLNLRDPDAVWNGFSEIMASCAAYAPGATIEGVIITPMCSEGVEMIAGITRDPQFGPMIMLGTGGILVELLNDVSFRAAPITERDASRMIVELHGRRLLEGFRGQGPADTGALIEFLVKLSALAVRRDSFAIKELDLNPIRVLPRGKGFRVLDARMATEQV